MKTILLQDVAELAKSAAGQIDKIYIHWTAGPYAMAFRDYHLNIDNDKSIYQTCEELTELKSHTWHRNSNAIGISMCCCEGARAYDGTDAEFGEYPPTAEQIEMVAQVVATLCKYLDIPIDSDHVMTHQEAATIDGYGPYSGDPETRWDLWYLPDYDNTMQPGGGVIRGKALWYRENSEL